MVDIAKWKRYQVMKTMGWTIRDYWNTPAPIIEEVWLLMNTEIKANNEVMSRGQ